MCAATRPPPTLPRQERRGEEQRTRPKPRGKRERTRSFDAPWTTVLPVPFHACPQPCRRKQAHRLTLVNKHQSLDPKVVVVNEGGELEAAWDASNLTGSLRPVRNLRPHPYTARCGCFSPLPPTVPAMANPRRAHPERRCNHPAANHLSHVDPIAVIAAARRTTHYLAKDGHFSNPMTRFVMRATGQIETHREAGGSDAVASAASILNNGKALGIFPEGTRSKRKEAPFLLPGKTGVARLAAAYPHAVVVPIALVGTRDIMQPQHHKWPRLYRRFDVNAGEGVAWLQWLDPRAVETSDRKPCRPSLNKMNTRSEQNLQDCTAPSPTS